MMKLKQISKLEMYSRVSDVLAKNRNRFETVQELQRTADTFQQLTTDIYKLKADAAKDLSTVEHAKVEARDQLIAQVLPIANILQVYALDSKQKEMGKKMSASKRTLGKLKDNALVEKAETIGRMLKKQYAKPNVSAEETAFHIANYGITREVIGNLEDSTAQFISAILEVKDGFDYKAKCQLELDRKIKEANTLLKKRLDKFLCLYKLNDSDFFESYMAARRIIKKIEKKKTAPSTAIDPIGDRSQWISTMI